MAAPSPVPGGTRKAAERRRLREELVAFLGRWRWEWFLHLTFRGIVHPEEADKRFRRFVERMNCDVYGPGWRERGCGFRWARASEYQRRGTVHFHVFMAVVGKPRARTLRPQRWVNIWHQLAGRATIEPIRNPAAAPRCLLKDVLEEGELDFGGPADAADTCRVPNPE